MKITTNREKTPFRPRSVTITFETQKELDAFGVLFNSGQVGDALDKVFDSDNDLSGDLWSELKDLGADLSTNHDAFISELKERLKVD